VVGCHSLFRINHFSICTFDIKLAEKQVLFGDRMRVGVP